MLIAGFAFPCQRPQTRGQKHKRKKKDQHLNQKEYLILIIKDSIGHLQVALNLIKWRLSAKFFL